MKSFPCRFCVNADNYATRSGRVLPWLDDTDRVAIWRVCSTPERTYEFYRQQEAIAEHPHRCVLRVRGFSASERDGIAVVTDAAPATTLATIRAQLLEAPVAEWTPTRKSKFVFGLAAGMEHIHALGVVHGDLRPANIFLNDDLEPVIGGAGIEAHRGDLCRVFELDFRAPESLYYPEVFDLPGDIYSFGMVLYSMFATPWAAQRGDPPGYLQKLHLIGNGAHVARHPTISDFQWDLMENCWHFDPSRRPSFEDIISCFRWSHSYVFDGAHMDEVMAYELETDEKFRASLPPGPDPAGSTRTWESLLVNTTCAEMSPDVRMFIRFADKDPPFLLLPQDTVQSLQATREDVVLLLCREEWPTAIVPARLRRCLLDSDDFEEIEPIGDPGTSGPVFRCRNKRTGREFASKVILPDRRNPEKSFREAAVHSSVAHETIATFGGLALPKVGLRSLMYTEYYPAGSVASFLRSHPDVSTTKRMIWIYGIALGMNLLHWRRIMHRDLKTSNVLLDAKLHPKICDFGLSRDFQGVNSLKQSNWTGTITFMAPELLMEEEFSWPVDVFAYGMTVWAIVAGQAPFADLRKTLKIMNQITSGERPPLPVGLPQACCDLITDCWNQNPRLRPTFPEIVGRLKSSGPLLHGVDEEYGAYVALLDETFRP
jgi:serine/threonine protein kinase